MILRSSRRLDWWIWQNLKNLWGICIEWTLNWVETPLLFQHAVTPAVGFSHKKQTWMAHPMFSDRRERSGWMSLFTWNMAFKPYPIGSMYGVYANIGDILMGAPWILWDILNMVKPSNFKGDDSAWRSMVFGSADYRHQVTQGEVGDFWGSESTSLNYPLGQVTTSITRKTRVCFTCFWIPPFFPWKHAQKKWKNQQHEQIQLHESVHRSILLSS